MVVTYLILCHKNPYQVKLMIEMPDCEDAAFVVHVDGKARLEDYCCIDGRNVVFVGERERANVKWGSISQVDAVLIMMHVARERFNSTYYWVCSGQDLPLTGADEICERLQLSARVDYISFCDDCLSKSGKQSNYDKRNQIPFPEWMVGKSWLARLVKRFYIELTGGYSQTYRFFLRKEYKTYRFYF